MCFVRHIDDVILNSSWSQGDQRGGAGLVVAFHSEGLAPGRFYDLLAALHQDPDGNRDLLELTGLCLSLGFIGPLREAPGGRARHAAVCATLAQTLSGLRPPEVKVPEPEGVPRRGRPFAVALLLGALVLAGGWLVATRDLALRGDAVLASLWPEPAPLVTSVTAVAPPLPLQAVLHSALADDLAQGGVTVTRSGHSVILGFERSRLSTDDGFTARLGDALAHAPGIVQLAAEGAPQFSLRAGFIGAEALRDQRARSAQSLLAALPGLAGRVEVRHHRPAGHTSGDHLRLTLNAGAPL